MEGKITGKYDCEQKLCPIKSTGVCLDAFSDVERCPHVKILSIKETPNIQQEHNDGGTTEVEQSFYTGDEIYEDKLDSITHLYSTKLVLLIGDSEAGKTTLLASLFDKFQKGPCAGYNFAGSRTQLGFEKRCFLARWTGSGKKIPDTERTKSLIMHYLHLAIRNQKGAAPIEHLIFTDVSGEQFRIIRDFESEMRKFNVIKRADHIFYLVNGEQLVDLNLRQKTKINTIKLVERAIECGMLNGCTPFDIVITKFDRIQGQLESINSFFVSDLKSKFPDHIKGFLYVASRSTDGGIGAGTGIDELLGKILNTKKEDKPTLVQNTSNREFQRFKVSL